LELLPELEQLPSRVLFASLVFNRFARAVFVFGVTTADGEEIEPEQEVEVLEVELEQEGLALLTD